MKTHSISVRKDGKVVRIYVDGNTLYLDYMLKGKRVRKSTGYRNNKEGLHIVKTIIVPQLLVKIATGEVYKKKSKSFQHYGEIFLKHKEHKLRDFYTRLPYFERVINHFGNKAIDKITRLDVKEYLLSLKMKSLSKGVYKSCINEIFELAVDDGILAQNPAINIRLPKDMKAPVAYFYEYEVEKILQHATGKLRVYLLIAFNTGMRPEEILALKFTDICNGIIEINKARTKKRIGAPKTQNSFRKLKIARYIENEINTLKSNSFYVFGNWDDSSKLRKQWISLLTRLDMKYRKLSCTRHTFATLMLQKQLVSINELSGLLGHSSPKVTLAHYSSVINSSLIDLGNDFALFGRDSAECENKYSTSTIDRAL